MSTALLKTKAEEENKKQTESTVKDPISAANFLMDSDLKSEDNELTFEQLSIIAMQLLQQARPPKQVSEAFKALSYLILDLHWKNTIESITDTVAKAISTVTKRVHDELDMVMDQLIQAATVRATCKVRGERL